MSKKLSQELRELISNGNLELVLELLSKEGKGSKVRKSVTNLSGIYNENKRKYISGLISNEEESISTNKIRESIIELIDEIEKRENKVKGNYSNKYKKKFFISLLLLLLGLFLTPLLFSRKYDITDPRDKNKYSVVEIEGLTWLSENLRFDTKDSNSWGINNSKNVCKKLGRLYTWESANVACSDLGEGWRLPTKQELASLMDFLRITGNIEKYLGGERDIEGNFLYQGKNGLIWSSTESNEGWVWILYIHGENRYFEIINHGDKKHGYSCLCVKK